MFESGYTLFMPDNSFDVVSIVDMPEVLNAVQQAQKEIQTRFDLKDSKSQIELNDKDKKLVGAVGQRSFGNAGLKPGEEDEVGPCMIHLPKGRYKDVVSFQAVIYETDEAPRKG